MSKVSRRDVDRLVETARRAQAHARCGYSHYAVGAAVLAASGKVYPGCNIESPTLIHHTCAERAAICNAISAGEISLVAICTVSRTAYPCGTCRQAILEFLEPGSEIYSILDAPVDGRPRMVRTTASALLPHAYGVDALRAGIRPAKRLPRRKK